MNELRYCVGNIGFEADGEDGEGGTLVELGRLSGEVDVVRDIPELDRGRRENLSGEDGIESRSPYNDVGRLLVTIEDESGELGTDVCVVVPERMEFSEEAEETVDAGLILSKVFERRSRDEEE